MAQKEKILICGILPPPKFGHSMTYMALMDSAFVQAFDIKFLNLHFWTYGTHKKVTVEKIWKLVKYLGQYISLLIRFRPKYVLYNMSFDKMPFLKDFLFCLIGKLFGSNIIIHDHGQYVRELYDSSQGFYRWLIKKFCSMATSSIVMGEGTKKFYEGFIDPSRLVVVPSCVHDFDRKFRNNGLGSQRDLNQIHVLYFSFLSKSKGVWTALKAIVQVIKTNSNIRFTFGGPFESEALEKEILEFVKLNHLQDYTEFLGYIDSDKKRTELLRESDIFIFPTHRDVFGLVLLHAMAESVPVIASREGTIPEIIEDGTSGLLFPKGDSRLLAEKILFLADNPGLREYIGDNGRKRYLEKYTPEVCARQMTEGIEKIISLGGV